MQALTAALTSTDAHALEVCSTNLRDAFMSLALLSQQQSRSGKALDAGLQQRIDAIGRQLGVLREQLVRGNAMLGHKVSALLPSNSPTYEALAGRSSRIPPPQIYRSQS